jgi:hypothetical protein
MMAGKGDTNGARQPTSSAHAFDGGIATKDVEPVWRTEALPGWVVHHLIPLLTAGQSWPKGSESKLWELRVEYVKLMNLLIGSLDPTAATVQTLNGSLQSPAKPAIFKRLAKLSDDKVGVVAKAQESFSYAKMVDNFARETQYSKLSVNVAFWVAVIAAFIALIAAGFFPLASVLLRSVGTAGATRIALIMQRLALVASRSGTVAKSGQITRLAGAGGGTFFNKALAFELAEEILEEGSIDAISQYQQIKMGTRDTWDWKKTKAAAIGAGTGAVVGTKLGGPMSRFTNGLPGISRLNRIAGDNRGVGNAFLRFPGRALNTGLNNMAASPAGSIVANYAVYDQLSLPGAEGMYGGFLGGAGRTNTISPFNPSVAGAITNPMSALNDVFESATATQQSGPTAPGNPGTAGSPGTGAAAGDSFSPAGPRPGSSDGTVAPAVPQLQGADLTSAIRRDRTGTVAEPAMQPAGQKRTWAVATPDIITPDANQTNRSQNGNAANTRQDPPAAQQDEKLEVQNQSRPADQNPDQGQESQSSRHAAPPAGQQATPTKEQAPAEPSAVPTGPPETSSAPKPAASPEATGIPEATGAPEPTNTPKPVSAPEASAAPELASRPDAIGEPQTVLPPEVTNLPQGTGTPHHSTTSEAANSTTLPAYAGDAATSAPTQQAPNGTFAPGLITRLIRAARRTKDAHALVTGRPDKSSGFVANGRHNDVPPLSVQEARAAFEGEVRASDLGATVTGLRWTGPGTLVVELDDLPAQTFVFEVGPVRRGRLGRTVVGDGNVNEVRLAPRVAPDQVARLVLHEIVDTLHARNHPRRHLLRRLGTLLSSRDECLTARQHEEAFLTRRISEVSAGEQPTLMAQRDAVRDILLAHGLPRLRTATPPSPSPVHTPSSVTDPLTRLRQHDQAVDAAAHDLARALAEQIDQLLQIEMGLQLQAMTATGTGADPLLAAVSRTRTAYEGAQSLLPTAGFPTTRVTDFAQAMHKARQLHLLYQEQVDAMATVSALPEAPPEPDVLRRHIAALHAVAADLAGAARTSPGTAADRQAAAASAVRAAETYQRLLDQVDAAQVVLLTPPNVLVTQMLWLGATYEQHYRQIMAQGRVASARDAQNIDELHRALLDHLSGRRSAAMALRATIETFGEVIMAQSKSVTAYNLAANHADALAAEALAEQHLRGARLWQARAEEFSRIAGQQERARQLAVAARDAHQELAVLLAEVIAGAPIDHTLLGTLVDAAAAALRTYQEEIDQLPPAAPSDLPQLSEVPPTAQVRLWTRIQERAQALEAAYLHNIDLSLRHRRDAETASRDALDAWNKAVEHGRSRDDSASERTRRQEVEAKLAASMADRHTRMAERYAAAAAAALHALQDIEPVLAALDEVTTPDDPRTPQVELALHELGTREEAYNSAYQATLPSAQALPGSKIAGPVANLSALTELVNEMLTQQGVTARITEEELRWSIRQAFHTVLSPDGMILRLNTATGAQLRLRLKLDDLREVARPDSSHSETMFGLLRQGGGQTALTDLLSLNGSNSLDMMALIRTILDNVPIGSSQAADIARLVTHFGVLRLNAKGGRGRTVTTSAQDTGLGGNVEDNRGMAAMFDARASWEVELLTASGRPVWRALPADDETVRQRLWISHAYLSGSPKTIQLPEADRRRTPFPEHVVSVMTGLSTLADQVTDRLENAGLSPVSRNQVTTMFTEDLPSYLGEAINNPSGLRRTITVNGQVQAVVTVRTRVVSEGELVGGPSTKHHQERLRNASSNAGQSRSDSHSGGFGPEVGFTADPSGSAAGDFAPHASVGVDPGRSSSVSTSANAVAIHPSVQRWAGHTQGYLLDLEHTVTIQVFGTGSETVPPFSEQSTGLLRIPEPDAYRYGLPVDAAAEVGHAPDGTVLLRDDPVEEDPPGRVGELPPWLGDGPGQTRGAGPALVQQVTGMDSIRARVEEELRARGLLPKLKNGVPSYSLIPWVRASQIANEQLIAEQFLASRLEAGYDQAAQEGLFINLVHHREGFAARHYTLRIRLSQDFTRRDYQGVTDAEPVVNLDIGSDTYVLTQNHGTSSQTNWRAGEGFRNNPGADAAALDGSYSHGKSGQSTTTTGTTVNQVTLMEGSGLTAVFRIPHTISVDLLLGPNEAENLVKDQAGDARVLLPADLLPLAPSDDGHPRPESPRHPTSQKAMRLAKVVHLDVRDMATTAANLLADPLDRDSPQFQHLATFFNVRNLISHPEVLFSGPPQTSSSGHRTGVDTRTATGEPQNQPVSLLLTPGESRFLSATDLVVGDINLTLGSHAGSTQRSKSQGAGITTGLPLPGKLGSEGGAGGSLSTTTAHEQKVIAGPERLGIDTGKQYAFAMDVTSELTVGSGAEAAQTRNGTVVYLLAERDALDLYASGEVQLPLHQVADAAERLMNGDLQLGRRVSVRFMDRYLEDLADARARNAGWPTVPGVPLTGRHTTHRALARLLELFSDDQLTRLMPPDVPPGPPNETAADTRDRMLSKPEFYPHVRDNLRAAAQRLKNGEVLGELAPNYSDSIGMSTVKQVNLHPVGEPDTDVDLLSQIRDAVNEVAPGALDQDNKLWRGLMTDFSRETWLGKIDSMLDPDSPGNDYTVAVDGVEDILEVTVRAELSEDVAYRGDVFDYGQIFQLYSMLEENVSESSNAAVSPSGKLGQEASENKDSGSTATNRGQTGKGASNVQQTRVQRVASFEGPLAEVRQGIRLFIEVRRVPKTQQARPGQVVPRLPQSVSRHVSGTIDRIIPAGMVSRPGAVPAPAPAIPDPRPIPVPENFVVGTTRVKDLAETVKQRLKDELGINLSPADSKALARLLSGNSRNSLFERMTAKDGHMVIQVPGNEGTTVRIHVGAVLSEPVVIAAGLKATEIGQADRRQWTTSANAERTRLRPTGITFGSDNRDELLPSGVTDNLAAGNRDQTVDSSSAGGGNRAETTVSERADADSVRFRVDYHVHFEVWSDPNTDMNPSDITPKQHVATGNVDVLLFDKAMRAIEEQAEGPGAVATLDEQRVRNVPAQARSLAELHAAPDVHDHRSLSAALSGEPGPVNIDADLSVPPYGQLRLAQLLSRERDTDVQITIHPANRQPETYIATPDGRLHPIVGDEAFARRFAGLPSLLIAAAEQHGIDLHELHQRTQTDAKGSLAEHLRHELSRRAIFLSPAPSAGWPVTAKPDDAEGIDPHSSDFTHGAPDPNSGFIPDGREEGAKDLTPAEATRSFLEEVIPADFGEAVTGIRWVSNTEVIVRHVTLGDLHFTVEVAPVEGGYLGRTIGRAGTGTSGNRYIMTLASRVASEQVARLVLHEISDVIQRRTEGDSHLHMSPDDRLRNECITARRNELRFLERKLRAAVEAGDTATAERLTGEIAAVKIDLGRRTAPPQQRSSIDSLLNWGVWTRPESAPGTADPTDVTSLLDVFPRETRPLTNHLLILQYMERLFRQESSLTQEHLEYTEALVETMHGLRDINPASSSDLATFEDLLLVKHLSDLLPGDVAPHRRLLGEQINTLLGLNASTPVADEQILYFAGIVDGVSPYPGESGPATIHRAVYDQRRRLENELLKAWQDGHREEAERLMTAIARIETLEQMIANALGPADPNAFPDDIRRLLDQFPPEDRPLMVHVQALRHMKSLFHNEPQLTLIHLENTNALISTAYDIYHDTRGYSPDIAELRRLKHLSDLLPSNTASHVLRLREQINTLLGRDTTPVDNQLIQDLVWIVSGVSPEPGEIGAATIHRAIKNELHRLQSDRLQAQQDRDTEAAEKLTRRIVTLAHLEGEIANAMEHLQLLEHAKLLFRDEPYLATEHLEHTNALVTSAREIYGTTPDIATLTQLKHLSDLLPGEETPHSHQLRKQINTLFGRDTTAPVDNQLIQDLVWIVSGVSPDPGETGPITIHRAIFTELYHLRSDLITAQQNNDTETEERLVSKIGFVEGLEREITGPAKRLQQLQRIELLFRDELGLGQEYTDALVATGSEIYSTESQNIPGSNELLQLQHLSSLLTGDAAPHSRHLREQINALLGRDPTTPVDDQLIHYFMATVTGVRPEPGETGPAAIHRAVVDELRRLESELREARQNNDTEAEGRLRNKITTVEELEREIASAEELAALQIVGKPDPAGANVFKVMLNDGSSALLLEHSTRHERDVQLLVTQLAHRLGLVGNARAAGERHILIDWTPSDSSPEFLGTREAVLAGYLVAVADMTPFVAQPTLHALAIGTPLLEQFLREDPSGERKWSSNPLSPSDIVTLGAMLEELRPDFARMDMLRVFELMTQRHADLAGGPLFTNAAGWESVVAAAPGHLVSLASDERFMDPAQDSSDTRADTGPPAKSRTIDAAERLRSNLLQGIVAERRVALGRVVRFADGSQALEVPPEVAEQVLVGALIGRALGLAGPAVHVDRHGKVWRTFGSNELPASLATGIARVIDVPGAHGRVTEVVFVDGRRAMRYEFPTQEAADEHEARLEEAHDARNGLQGSHRVTPFVIYDEIVEPDAGEEARLAARALYTLLSHGGPMDHTTLRRLLDANPLLSQFGEAFDEGFRAGAPVLSASAVAELAGRLKALRGVFHMVGLGSRYEQLLSMLSDFTGSDEARLIPLAFSENSRTPEYRVPAWRAPLESRLLLDDLLRSDHLAQARARNLTDLIARAEAQLAGRPTAKGHVFARVPVGVIPPGIRPGERFALNTLLDGVDNSDLLAEYPHGIRVTIQATDYVPVEDLSGKPHHALFRPGTFFSVTGVLRGDDGEVHYLLTQTAAPPVSETVIAPAIPLSRELAADLATLFRSMVSKTRAGMHFRNGLEDDAAHPAILPIDGAFVVEGRYVEQGMMVGGRRLRAEVIAAMLLNAPDLHPDAAILLTGPHDGTTTFAQDLARFTGRIVLAPDGPVETTPLGNLRAGDGDGRSSPQFRMLLPAQTSSLVAERLRGWLGPALPAMSRHPSAPALDGEPPLARLPLAEWRPRGASLLPQTRQLTEAEELLMRNAYRVISGISEQAAGRAFRLQEIRDMLKYINPTRSLTNCEESLTNCIEVALAVDDILGGRPAVAGPRGVVLQSIFAKVYSGRAVEHWPYNSRSISDLEEFIRRNMGSRGIIFGVAETGVGHAYNIANIGGRMAYIDGQSGIMSSADIHPRKFLAFNFYRTA